MSTGLQVVLRRRQSLVYQGKAEAVTAFNSVGEFDVLENHAQIVAIIRDKVVLHQQGNYRREFEIKSGILSVMNNFVKVFIDI